MTSDGPPPSGPEAFVLVPVGHGGGHLTNDAALESEGVIQ